jgi:hypothetical protein
MQQLKQARRMDGVDRAWAIAVLNGSFVLHYGLRPPGLDGFWAGVLVLAALLSGLCIFGPLLGGRAVPAAAFLQRHPAPVLVSMLCWLFVYAAVPLGDSAGLHLLHKHGLLVHGLTLLILFHAVFPDALPRRRVRLWMACAVGLAAVVIVFRVLGVTSYPFTDWQDEPWVMGWTLNYLRTGVFGDPTLLGLGDAYYAYPRFYVLMAGWFDLFGAGLFQGRLLGFVLIFPVIGFSYLAARNWFGQRSALFTAITLLASAILASAARIRHDIGLTICMAAALWLHTEGVRRGRTLLHMLAGLVSGLGMFSHYHAVGFTGVLLIGLYLPRWIANWRQGKRLPEAGALAFALGGLAGGVTVLLLQMLPDDLSGFLWALGRQSKFSESTGEFNWAFIGNFITIGFFSIVELVLVALGVWAALRRRTQADLTLLLLVLLGHVALAIMASGAIYYYILPLVPVYAMLIARLFVPRSAPDPERISARSVAQFALCITPLLAATAAPPALAVLSGRPPIPPPHPAAAWVMEHVPRDATVVGDLRYYLWLSDYRFGSHLVPEYLTQENFDRFDTIPQVWQAADADVYLIDTGYPRSMKYFAPLLASDYWREAGYVLAAQVPSAEGGWQTDIYVRDGLLPPG